MKVLRNKRAFSLLELVIAGVITLVMMTMTVSFSIMTHGWTTVGQARYDLLASEHRARAAVVDFLSLYDTSDNYLRTGLTSLEAVSIVGDNVVGRIEYTDGALSFDTPEGEHCVYPLDYVLAVRWEVQYSATTRVTMVRLRFDYSLPTTNATGETNGVYTVVQTARAVGVKA